MPAWPATLPQFVLESGYREQMPDTNLESQMDVGPAKVRPRSTVQVRPISFSVAMSPGQALIFEDFYINTLQNGTQTFTWVHPRTQLPATYRFRKPAPAPVPFGSGQEIRYAMTLEILPS
jgi:hypothetical protein